MDTAVATQVAEGVLATARDTIDDVIETVRDFTSDVAENGAPKKKRHPVVTLLVLVGLGALVFVVIKRLTAAEEDAAETLDAVAEDVVSPVTV